MKRIVEIILAGSTYTPRAGVTLVDAHVFAPGGHQAFTVSSGSGGGAYSFKAGVVVPQDGVPMQIGTEDTLVDTWFKADDEVLAKAGEVGPNSSTPGDGGSAAEGVGDIKFSGGDGGTRGTDTGSNVQRGGGHGGQAGPNGDGGDGGDGVASQYGGGGGGANGGDPGGSGASAGAQGAGGDNRNSTGGGAPPGGDGSNGGGGAGGRRDPNTSPGEGSRDIIFTDNSGRENDGVSIGPRGGGGGSPAGVAGATVDGHDGFIVLEYWLPSPGMMMIFEDSF